MEIYFLGQEKIAHTQALTKKSRFSEFPNQGRGSLLHIEMLVKSQSKTAHLKMEIEAILLARNTSPIQKQFSSFLLKVQRAP